MAEKLFNNSRFTFVGELAVGKKGAKTTTRLSEKSDWYKTRGNFGIKANGSNQFLNLEFIHSETLGKIKIFGANGEMFEVAAEDTTKQHVIEKAAPFILTTVDLEPDQDKKKERMSLVFKRKNHEDKETKTEEDLAKIEEYTKQINELSDKRLMFCHVKDVINFLELAQDGLKGKKLKVTGNVKSNYYNSKNTLQFIPSVIELAGEDEAEGLTMTADVFYEKDSIEDDKKDKKMFIAGYIGDRVKKANKLFPIALTLDYTKINEDIEEQAQLLEFMKSTFEITDKKQVHKIGVKINIINGSEKIEFDESCLTQKQLMAVKLGMAKIEDFKPKGGAFGEFKQELKVVCPLLREYPQGCVEVFPVKELGDYLVSDDSDLKASDVKEDKHKEEVAKEKSTEDMLSAFFS